MELRHMRYFLAVGEELNFRKAAERLNIAQPSLSVQIQDMEYEIGTPLLQRSTHRVALTPAGLEFLESCRRLLRDVEDSKQKALRIAGGEWGRLAVGFVPSLGYQLLPRALRAYRTKYPDVELQLSEMDTSRQIRAIEDHQLDLGLIGLGQSSERLNELQTVLVAEERLFAVMPKDHVLSTSSKRQSGVSLRSLAAERFLLADPESAPLFNPWLKVLCQQAGFQPSIVQESGQPITVLNYVAAGLGITVLPGQYKSLVAAGVAFLPLVRPIVHYRYYAAWIPQKNNPSLQRFIDSLRQTVRTTGRQRGKISSHIS